MATNESVAKFQRRLARIPHAVRGPAFARLAAGAQDMAATMRSAVPRDSGMLAETITVHPNPARLQVTIVAGGRYTTRSEHAGKPSDYARFVEFGTVDTPRQPYFWPVYRLLKKKVRSSVKRAMSKATKAAFNSGGG